MTRWLMSSLLAASGSAFAGDPASPTPVPLTRPVAKQAMEDLKHRTPRIPLPPLTADEESKLGERERGYESRVRSTFLAYTGDGRGGFGFGREADPELTLSNTFKVKLFWLVSRTNNCLY